MQSGRAWLVMGLVMGLGLMTGCSSDLPGDAQSGATSADHIDEDALKRAVITRIANEHHFDAGDVTDFSATVTDLGPQPGNTKAAYRVTGTFRVDASTPSNVYEAATQRVNSNICMVAPDRCQGAHFRHSVRFDVTARVLSTLDGSLKLMVEGPVVVDDRQPTSQPANTAVAPAHTPASARPAPSGPFVGAAILSRPPPRYPPQAVRQRHTGTVVLDIAVDGAGQLDGVAIAISSGFRELDTAAQSGVRNWTFRSATRGGEGVASTMRVPVTFSLGMTGNDAPAPAAPTPSAMPEPAAGPSFDCSKASTPTERTICASPELSALDGRMGQAYRARLSGAAADSVSVRDAQRAFIREREMRCQDDARCIRGMLSSRLGELQ